MKKAFNIIGHVFLALLIALAIWFFASWGEVICKNKDEHPQYSEWNLIIITEDLLK